MQMLSRALSARQTDNVSFPRNNNTPSVFLAQREAPARDASNRFGMGRADPVRLVGCLFSSGSARQLMMSRVNCLRYSCSIPQSADWKLWRIPGYFSLRDAHELVLHHIVPLSESKTMLMSEFPPDFTMSLSGAGLIMTT